MPARAATASTSGASAAASSQPRFMPWPPMGLISWAASPISTVRPVTIRRASRMRTPKLLSMLLLPASTSIPVRSRDPARPSQPGVSAPAAGRREADHPAAHARPAAERTPRSPRIPGTGPRPDRTRWCRRSRPSGSGPGSPSPGPAMPSSGRTVERTPSAAIGQRPPCTGPPRRPRRGVHGDLAAVVVQPRDPDTAVQGAGVELPDALFQDGLRPGLRQGQDEREAVRDAGKGHLGERPAAADGDAAPDRDPLGHQVRRHADAAAARPATGDGCRWPGSAVRRRSAVPGPGRSRRAGAAARP